MKIDSNMISNAYQTSVSQEKEASEVNSFKDKLEQAANDKDLTKLKEASQEFEAYFINTLFKEMRKTVQDGGLVEKSDARTTFEGMLDEEMSKSISKTGGIGLADMIYNNMVKVYSASTDAPEDDVETQDAIENTSNASSLDLKG
ncbi:rod-binding protein [Fusibacter bizertensis]